MSSPTQNLPKLQDYLVRKDRELRDQLKELSEALKHLQRFPEHEESLLSEQHELQKQLAQLNGFRKHLEDTSTSNRREVAKSAYPVNNFGTQDGRGKSPHVNTATAHREQLSQQPSRGHTPQLATQSMIAASKPRSDEIAAPQILRPKPSEAVSCAECGQKTARIPSAVNQLCLSCRSGGGRSSMLTPSAALEGRERSNKKDSQPGDMVSNSPITRTKSPSSNALPVARRKREISTAELPTNQSGTKLGRIETVRRLVNAMSGNHQSVSNPSKEREDTHRNTAQIDDFDQLDAKNYPTVMWFDGAYREFWCFGCGGNVSDFDDGSRKRSRPPGQWWLGIRGLHSHIANKHHVNPADHGFNASVKKMGWYEIAHVCMKKNLARRLSGEDVERIENKREPSVPIVMRVSFKKTFAQAEQEYRMKVNASPPVFSPGYMTATPAAEEPVNGSTPSYKRSHNHGTHTTALGTGKDTGSQSHYRSPHLSDHAAETFNKTNGTRDVFDYDSRGLKRSNGGAKVPENYVYDSDEYDEDDAPIAPKRRRVIDQTFTSDTES